MIDADVFLRQEIESASPAKLRWMLIRKANGLCDSIERAWQQGDLAGGRQWIPLVQDILNELLSGVVDPSNPSSESIADLYVFLIQTVVKSDQETDREMMRQVRDLLAFEEETWRLYVELESKSTLPVVPHFASAPQIEMLSESGAMNSQFSFEA